MTKFEKIRAHLSMHHADCELLAYHPKECSCGLEDALRALDAIEGTLTGIAELTEESSTAGQIFRLLHED